MKFQELSGDTPQTSQTNQTRQLVMANMLAASPVLNAAQFYTFVGSMDKARSSATATGGRNRAINEWYPPNPTTPEFQNVSLSIIGDVIHTDLAYQRRGGDIESEHLREVESFGKAMGRKFSNDFFNGDSTADPKQMDGLNRLISTPQIVNYNDTVPLGATASDILKKQKFIEVLTRLTLSIQDGAEYLFCNEYLIARLRSLGLDYVQTTTVQNALGEPQALTTFAGIPLVNAGMKSDGNLIVGNNELVTIGGVDYNDATSVYAVRFGEKENVTVGTNTGLWVETTRQNQWVETAVDFDAGVGILNPKSIKVIKGIRIV